MVILHSLAHLPNQMNLAQQLLVLWLLMSVPLCFVWTMFESPQQLIVHSNMHQHMHLTAVNAVGFSFWVHLSCACRLVHVLVMHCRLHLFSTARAELYGSCPFWILWYFCQAHIIWEPRIVCTPHTNRTCCGDAQVLGSKFRTHCTPVHWSVSLSLACCVSLDLSRSLMQ